MLLCHQQSRALFQNDHAFFIRIKCRTQLFTEVFSGQLHRSSRGLEKDHLSTISPLRQGFDLASRHELLQFGRLQTYAHASESSRFPSPPILEKNHGLSRIRQRL
jgi:hypothetical protein